MNQALYAHMNNKRKMKKKKKFTRAHLNQWLGVVVCACHPSYVGKHK
jgi:hypothetical protein